MTEFLEKYLELRKKWSRLAYEGKEEEYKKLVKEAHEELYPHFSTEDWEYLIKSAPNNQAKIYIKKQADSFNK